MKKLITLLMAVSIMLTSCGKSSGLSNGGKKADNKSLAVNTSPKPQPQKNDDTANKTPAINTSTKNLPQKIDNNIKHSWTGDHMFEIISISVIVIAIAIGSIFWIIKNKSPQTTDPKELSEPSRQPEIKGQPQISKPLKMLDIRPNLGRADYETHYLSYPDINLTVIINSNSFDALQKQCATAELEKRKRVPFSIPEGVDISSLINLSVYTNEALEDFFGSLAVGQQQAINFIFKCRGKIE
jgi:nitrogen fixation-related uncharacterized protein